MKKAISLTLTTLVFTFSTSVYSAQFSSIIDAMAIPKNVEYNVSSWENAEKIQGVEWKWPYYESGAHDRTMEGTTKVGNSKNPNIGYTEVTITGTRTFMTAIEIMIQNEGENPSESEVNKLFGSGKVIKIASSCDNNNGDDGDATYHFTRAKYQPVFIRYSISWGAAGKGASAGGADITVANRLADLNSRYGYEDCYNNRTLDKWAVN